MKFKSKPVEIEAEQYDANNPNPVPNWAQPFLVNGIEGGILAKTLNGEVPVNHSDWIIFGMNQDEVYPCPDEVFHQKYRPVEDLTAGKESSSELAALAGRILASNSETWTVEEVRSLAASVLSQAEKEAGMKKVLLSRIVGYPRVTAIDDEIIVHADEKNPDNGNASHHYSVTLRSDTGVSVAYIQFQDGPIAEAGINGVGQEAILAVLIDRMQSFQSSKYSCKENAVALTHLEEALNMLNSRTLKRKMHGVEGTHGTRPEEGRKPI